MQISPQWYCGRAGQQSGPFTEEQVKEFAASGQLLPTDLVWRQGMAQWTTATAAGLFPATPVEAPPALPPVHEQLPLAESPAAVPSSAAAAPSDDAKELPASWASRGKAAGVFIARQAQRTTLQNVTLPGHYHALGKHLYGARRYQDEFASFFQAIDGLTGEINALEARSANKPKAEGMIARAKAAAKAAQDMLQVKALQVKRGHALAELGRTAFEKYGNECGPEELIRPIVDVRSRLDGLTK
jgi:hypothetical protein